MSLSLFFKDEDNTKDLAGSDRDVGGASSRVVTATRQNTNDARECPTATARRGAATSAEKSAVRDNNTCILKHEMCAFAFFRATLDELLFFL